MKVFRAAALYFLILFAAGFVLGAVRVLWAAPLFGERAAELSEMPLMLAVMFPAARWVVRRFAVRPGGSVSVGLLALGLLLVAELAVVLRLRGLTFAEYAAGRDPVSGAAYVLMLVLFAIMPWLVARRYQAMGGGVDGRLTANG